MLFRSNSDRALPWAVSAARPGAIGEHGAGAGLRHVASPDTVPVSDPVTFRLRPLQATPPRILLIGSSTGGPQALATLIEKLPAAIDRAPVLITQHMPPTFTTVLAEHLSRIGARGAHEAEEGEPVLAGGIYVAPGGRHMRVVREADGVKKIGRAHV